MSMGQAAGHAGFAGHTGFSGSHSFSKPAPRFGRFSPSVMPIRRGRGVPYRGISPYRPAYRPSYGNRRGQDRNRWRRGWYGGTYPAWGYVYPYPYVIDPGFYDWSDTGDYGNGQDSAANEYAPYADYGMPSSENAQHLYPAQQGDRPSPYPYAQPPGRTAARPAYGSSGSSITAEQPLTLIFKNGRAPQTIQNYMMNTTELTDLDPQHFARIPLDEIDLVATIRINRAHGVNFEVPRGTR